MGKVWKSISNYRYTIQQILRHIDRHHSGSVSYDIHEVLSEKWFERYFLQISWNGFMRADEFVNIFSNTHENEFELKFLVSNLLYKICKITPIFLVEFLKFI